AGLPALAVSLDGTVGLLFMSMTGTRLSYHFCKFFNGDFSNPPSERVLASFPINPAKGIRVDVGDCLQVRAVNYNFYCTFAAWNDPRPGNFPSGVYYQRNVKIGDVAHDNIWLQTPAALADLSKQPVTPSVDA